MNFIKFLLSKSYRKEYTKSLSDKLENEQLQRRAVYRLCFDSSL